MTLIDQICRLEVENAILKIKVQQLEEVIGELIDAVDYLSVCPDCHEESGEFFCSECPWHQAKVKAIRLLAKEESE